MKDLPAVRQQLRQIDLALEPVRRCIPEMEAAQLVAPDDLRLLFERAADLGADVRRTLLSLGIESWADRIDLEAKLDELEMQMDPRTFWSALADDLRARRVGNERVDRLREAAIGELELWAAEEAQPPVPPLGAPEVWVSAAVSLPPEALDSLVASLGSGSKLGRLLDVIAVDPDRWHGQSGLGLGSLSPRAVRPDLVVPEEIGSARTPSLPSGESSEAELTVPISSPTGGADGTTPTFRGEAPVCATDGESATTSLPAGAHAGEFAPPDALAAEEPPSEPIEVLPGPPPLPDNALNLEQATASLWVNSHGEVEMGPWSQPGFVEHLTAVADASFVVGDMERLALLSGGIEVDPAAPWSREVVHAIVAMRRRPSLASLGRFRDHAKRLAQAQNLVGPTPGWKVVVALQALVPSQPLVGLADAEALVSLAGFSGTLAQVLVHCLQVSAGRDGHDPVGRLRAALQASEAPSGEVKPKQVVSGELLEARAALAKLAHSYRGAKHFGIPWDHCVDAWARFYETFHRKVLTTLRPEAQGGSAQWNPKEMDKEIRRIETNVERAITSGRVRESARRIMLEVAGELADASVRVNEAMRELIQPVPTIIVIPETDAAAAEHVRFLASTPPLDPTDVAINEILQRVCRGGHGDTGGGNVSPPVEPEDELALRTRAARALSGEPPKAADVHFERAASAVQRVALLARSLDELADTGARGLEEWARMAQAELDQRARQLDPRVVDHVAKGLAAWAEPQLRYRETELAARAAPAARSTALRLLTIGDHAGLMLLVHGHPARQGGAEHRIRETAWRWAAQAACTTAGFLSEVREGNERLVDSWQGGSPASAPFVDALFESGDIRRRVSELVRRGEYDVEASALVEYIRNKNLNPTFLPQLRVLQGVVFVAARGALAEYVTRSLLSDASRFDQKLVVVLAPGVGPERAQALEECRSRQGTNVAIVDDIDLWRLLRVPLSRRIVGLLEIALEQLPLTAGVMPFPTAEGRAQFPELFVGREDELAKVLGRTPNTYTRIFSGRRLGKSALLSYIAQTMHGSRSGDGFLHVLFLDLTQMADESEVVRAIHQSLSEKLDFRPSNPPRGEPSSTLGLLMREWAKDRRFEKDELLLLLDEADTFIEAQMDGDRRRPQSSLSWKMRQVQGMAVRNGRPRIRFVFAGYRVTNTHEGAWANWDDVLKLKPLHPAKAHQLISGPLAKLGIDAQNVASSIAWRCGYQPVLLLRFGHLLYDRLAAEPRFVARSGGASVEVTPADVAAVFADHAMREEIRTVVLNNFQTDRVGKYLYQGLLLALSTRGAVGLVDPASELQGRLTELNVGRPWPGEDPASSRAIIQDHLREFEERSLISIDRTSGIEVANLRFPHHLGVLITPGLEERIREAVRERHGTRVYGILEPAIARTVEEAFGPSDRERPPIVLAGPWPALFTQKTAGVLACAGVQLAAVVPVDAARVGGVVASRPAAILGVTGDVLAEMCERHSTAAPFVRDEHRERFGWAVEGGLDLLRHVLAGRTLCPVPIGRLQESRLRWWFQAQGVEVPSHGGISELHRCTHGVPFLVATFLEHLNSAGADQEDGRSWVAAGAAFEDGFVQVAKALSDGPPSVRLSPREREIIWMVAQVSGMARSDEVLEDYLGPSLWSTLFPEAAAKPLSPEDVDAVRLLQYSGFLPVGTEADQGLPTRLAPDDPLAFGRIVALHSDDPMNRLAALLA